MEYIAKNKFPWDILFDATTEPVWRSSLNSYLKALHEFHASEPSKLKDAEKTYLEERLRHLDQSKHKIPRKYLDIRNEEIRIGIEELSKQIEEEVTSIEEEGKELSDTQSKENVTTVGVSAKVGGEVGLVPKVTGEISGKLEDAISISNQQQKTQSKLLRTEMISRKSRYIGFKLSEAENLYKIEAANAEAIKGIIATIE